MTAAIVLGASGVAQAQQQRTANSDAASASAQDSTYSGVEDIIVTAEKRSESAQRTPAAVTALTGAALSQRGVNDLRAAQAAVPAARFQQEGQSTQVFLRGIGSSLDTISVDQLVAFSINGAYIPREGTSVPFFDIDRLEVLPGPQGTLYGRSSIGGTINIAFKRPTHEFETSGIIEGGNYGMFHATAIQNIPLAEDLAIRAAADYGYREGYMETGADSKNEIAGRLSLLYDPNPGLTVYLWGYGVEKSGYVPGLVNKGFNPETGAYDESAFLRDRPWDDLRPGALSVFAPFGQPTKNKLNYSNWVTGAEIDIGVADSVTLSYLPTYFYLDLSYIYNLGAVPAHMDLHYSQITQELRLNGDTERLKWLAGVYAYRQTGHQRVILAPGLPFEGFFFDADRDLKSGVAVFGQATYSVSDALRATLGGRYSWDKRSAHGLSGDGVTPYSFRRTFNRFDFKAGIEYDLAPRALAYLTYQTGYTPGSYNPIPATPTEDNLVKPATLSAITGGVKTRLLDNKVQLNTELFYYDYRNLLVQQFNQNNLFNPVVNAQKVEIYGVQVDLVLRPDNSNSLTLNVAYTHARNKDFILPDGNNYNGLRPAYAADLTIAADAWHDFRFGGGGYVRAQADARHEGPFYGDFVHSPGTRQKAFIKTNASLTYRPQSEKWSAGLWIKNITNEAVLAATAAGGIPGPATAYLEPPRTYGGRVTFNF